MTRGERIGMNKYGIRWMVRERAKRFRPNLHPDRVRQRLNHLGADHV